jgi:hypothetical protein
MLKTVDIRERPNDRWSRFAEDRSLGLVRNPILRKEDPVFAMGSCFAREIRIALAAQGIRVGPDYDRVEIDLKKWFVDELPNDVHLNYYNTFTILQEFQRISGAWERDSEDYWQVRRGPLGLKLKYQDPYKRLTFAATPDLLFEIVGNLNAEIDAAAKRARIFFFTFGMAEVFRKRDNGLIAGQKPAYLGGGGSEETELHLSTTAENLANLEELRRLIKALNPEAHLVVTVSPVPLERTFSNRDIVVANSEGKSILRAAVGEFARAHDDVTYFPAYEIVTALGEQAFEKKDLRHVRQPVVQHIMQAFLSAHVER